MATFNQFISTMTLPTLDPRTEWNETIATTDDGGGKPSAKEVIDLLNDSDDGGGKPSAKEVIDLLNASDDGGGKPSADELAQINRGKGSTCVDRTTKDANGRT